MNGKRILIVPPNDLLRHPIPNRIYHIAKHLSKDYSIVLFSYPNHPLRNGVLRKLNAKEIIYKAIRTKDLGIYYIINAPNMLSIMNQLIKEVDVVIHANVIPSLLVTRSAKRYGKVAIYDYLDHFPQSASAYYRGLTRNIVERSILFLVLEAIRNSTTIVTPSFGFASFIRQYTNRPVHIIPNGVEPDLFKPMDMNLARKNIGVDYDGPILLLYGSIDVWLDMEPILYIVKRNKDIRLLIVGYTHAKYYYRFMEVLIKKYDIGDRVFKYPSQSYEKIPLFINASNIIIAPYAYQVKNFTTPLKIIESLACARPVITNNIPEFRLWFKEGVFYYKSYQDIYELLNKLIKESDIIQYKLFNYAEMIRSRYSWKNIAEAYKKVIEGEYLDINSNYYKV